METREESSNRTEDPVETGAEEAADRDLEPNEETVECSPDPKTGFSKAESKPDFVAESAEVAGIETKGQDL